MANKVNQYTCQDCGQTITTIDRVEGVTPFLITCEATADCKGAARSHAYEVDQALKPAFEWYRPAGKKLRRLTPSLADHVRRGGLLLRPIIVEVDYRSQAARFIPTLNVDPSKDPIQQQITGPRVSRAQIPGARAVGLNGVVIEFQNDGSVRTLNKPLSRRKRQRLGLQNREALGIPARPSSRSGPS